MTVYVLGIGSNENAEYQCHRMISAIKQAFGEVKLSELVISKAVGIDAPDYMNGVVCFESDIRSEELRHWCKALEQRLGREQGHKLCAADVDILLAYDIDASEPVEALSKQVEESWFQPLVTQVMK